jgi:hypothetical protein
MSLPVRNCLACGQVDTDPRHVITLPDHSEVGYHMDCHARMNPPCEACVAQTETAQGVTGDAFREHLISPEQAEYLAANHADLLEG